MIGSKKELAIIDPIAAEVNSDNVLVAAGKTNIPQLAAMLKMSDLLVTGDTGPSAAVERLGKDADLLVSEVIDLPVILESLKRRGTATAINLQPLIDHMAQEHLTPENVGKLAAAAGVKKVILTHFAQPPGMEPINRKRILAGIRLHYKGPVAFGDDLASF